jgi:hypothetical protein
VDVIEHLSDGSPKYMVTLRVPFTKSRAASLTCVKSSLPGCG